MLCSRLPCARYRLGGSKARCEAPDCLRKRVRAAELSVELEVNMSGCRFALGD